MFELKKAVDAVSSEIIDAAQGYEGETIEYTFDADIDNCAIFVDLIISGTEGDYQGRDYDTGEVLGAEAECTGVEVGNVYVYDDNGEELPAEKAHEFRVAISAWCLENDY